MADAVRNEDWVRLRTWDLPTTLDGLLVQLDVLHASESIQRAALRRLRELPCYEAVPTQLAAAIEEHISGGG